MGYQSVLRSPEYITKSVRRLLNSLRQRFHKYTRNIVNCEDFLSLEQFQIWLENRVKEQYNVIANILASGEPYKNRDNPIRLNNFSNKNNNTDREIKCWLCENKHKITSCDKFKAKSLSEKKRFAEQEKLYWNCLAKGHILKNCGSEVRCRVSNCSKRHHTLLHEDIPLKTNGVQPNSFNKSSTHKTFLQIVPVAISNGNRFIRTKALLDTGSDATLLKREIATRLGLIRSTKRLTVTNALLKTTEFDSKLVSFENIFSFSTRQNKDAKCLRSFRFRH